MFNASDSIQPLRKCALALYCMTETDRTWVLQQLEPSQRSQLQTLIQELASMDFPRDQIVLRQFVSPPMDDGNTGDQLASSWEALEMYPPTVWNEVLSHESLALVSHVSSRLSHPMRQAISQIASEADIGHLMSDQQKSSSNKLDTSNLRDKYLRQALHKQLKEAADRMSTLRPVFEGTQRPRRTEGVHRSLIQRMQRSLRV